MIKNARREINLTQKELARKIGITQSYLSKLESNQSNMQKNVSVDTIKKMAKALNISSVELFLYFSGDKLNCQNCCHYSAK